MTIALVAHDTKKELMVQFCIAYRQILSEHRLIATGTTGRLVAEATGLNVQRFLPGGHGGDQQIVARIACDEVDMLLFFRDPICAKPSEPNEMNLLRICDVHNIPVATNIATAEVLGTHEDPNLLEDTRPLMVDFVRNGELLPGFTGEEGVRRATARHAASLAELPEAARRLSEGEPIIPTEFI